MFAGCTARMPVVGTLERDLHASLRVTSSGPVAVGSEVEVEFVVQNNGQSTVNACFGPAFEATFFNGTQAQGSAVVVDHPGCQQEFELSPGQSASRRYVARVPVIGAGVAKVGGGVQVVDPKKCDRYGCDRAWLRAAYESSVEVVKQQE